ncbi:DoxX family protein [Limnobacter humi]|uniref:DoxX family protein n=1 Tax=Limnobacter humi TaxID=1778671 RepID=UPI0027418517|nr:DoxX family protein [Limnobacter humi]
MVNSTNSSNFINNIFESVKNPLAVIARILLALMFVLAGFDKLTHFSGTVGFIGSAGLPVPEVLAAITLTVEIVGGLALITGIQARLAGFVLAGFTLLASITFHNFWAVPADQAYVQQLLFMKNISVAGGLLLVAALGAGQWKLGK